MYVYEFCKNLSNTNSNYISENKLEKLKNDNTKLLTYNKKVCKELLNISNEYENLKKEFIAATDDYDKMCDYAGELEDIIDNTSYFPGIRDINYCDEPGKEKTIVIFNDGTKIIKRVSNDDKFDLNVGVALCIAEKMFGSKNKFHKMINKCNGVKNKLNK